MGQSKFVESRIILIAISSVIALLASGLSTQVTVDLSKSGSSILTDPRDTVYGDLPFFKRTYNWNSAGKRTPSVPFVELDTNTYDKKFWIGHKRLLSPSVESHYPRVAAEDSLVYATFSVIDSSRWYVFRTFSLDYGLTWSAPLEVDYTGTGDAGHCFPIVLEDTIRISYSRTLSSPSYLDEIVIRNDLLAAGLTAPLTIDSSTSTSHGPGLPHLLATRDTLLVCYTTWVFADLTNYLDLKGSADNGYSWYNLGRAGTGGWPFSFVNADSVLSIIHLEGLEIVVTQSFDGGYTWTEDVYVSADDEFSSQSPHAASDSVSDIHAGWYDFDGAPPGWYGYIFYRRSLDAGLSWEPIRSLSTEPCSEDVAFWADTNRVYSVWNDCRENGSPDFALYLRYSHDRGASWSPEREVVDKIDPAREPDLYGQGDLIYLVWEEQHPPDWVWGVYFMVGGWYVPGDVDRSEDINIADLTYLVAYLFQGGPPPLLLGSSDMDGLQGINVADVTYLVSYLFIGGPPPVGR